MYLVEVVYSRGGQVHLTHHVANMDETNEQQLMKMYTDRYTNAFRYTIDGKLLGINIEAGSS